MKEKENIFSGSRTLLSLFLNVFVEYIDFFSSVDPLEMSIGYDSPTFLSFCIFTKSFYVVFFRGLNKPCELYKEH